MNDVIIDLFRKYHLDTSYLNAYHHIGITFINNNIEYIDTIDIKIRIIITELLKYVFEEYNEISLYTYKLFNNISNDKITLFNALLYSICERYFLLLYHFEGKLGDILNNIYSLKNYVDKYNKINDVDKYVDYLLSNESKFLTNTFIINLVNNSEYLKDKYIHIINAKKFDIL